MFRLAVALSSILGVIFINGLSFKSYITKSNRHVNKVFCSTVEIDEASLTSNEIIRLKSLIESTTKDIGNVKLARQKDEEELQKLDKEFGSEITRIKKEFSRMKERAYEEATEISNKAKIDALKEVLPITDNFFRAKGLFVPAQSEGEEKILKIYEDIFDSFTGVLAEFGAQRVESLGQKFDFYFMEAIMTAPSDEYAKDIVCKEYQIGYKMGDKCIRPSMVVVSLGPGPVKQ